MQKETSVHDLVVFWILFALIAPPQVYASERIVLLGRGLQMRGSADNVALACVTPDDCSKARFVHFKDDGTTEWIGSEMEIPTAPTEKLQNKAERLRLRYYIAERMEKRKGLRGVWGGVAAFFLINSGIIAASFLPEGAPVAIGMLTIMVPAVLFAIPVDWEAALVSTNSKKIFEVTHDQNGWNWSESPKVVSKKRYERFLSGMKSAPKDVRFFYLNRLEDKIRKLMEKGADFGCMDGVICYEGFPAR